MRSLLVYTLARLGLFAAAFGLIWLLGVEALVWDELTVLWTALVALAVSSVLSYWLLARLREDLAEHVAGRARRLSDRFEEHRRAEDDD